MHSLLSHLSGPVSVSVCLCRHTTASAFAQCKCIFAYLKRRNLLEYKHTLNIQIVFKLGGFGTLSLLVFFVLVLDFVHCGTWIFNAIATATAVIVAASRANDTRCVSCVHMPVYIFELPAKCYRIVKSQ